MTVPSLIVRAASAAASATSSATASATTSSSSGHDANGRPPVFKAVGIILAVSSGLLIGSSFVLKKVGLLRANVKYNEEAGEGYGYLKNFYWWGGMALMALGELCNFVAYAFVDAILVTPMGALSVVVTTILSAIFLKERLSFVGKVGCVNCIIGSVVIAMNAPQQSSVSNIDEMQNFVIAPGFLSYAGVIIVCCAFLALWAGPRYGKRSMFVYLSICSLIGGLSVVATQGLGAAIVAQIQGREQFKHWFLYVLLVFVVITLATEIIYLNKALNIYNAALVTPTYYVIFTSATIVTSAVLFKGFKGSAISITTVVMGFLQICCGVVLLQLSKSAKDVPDTAVFKGDLNQLREVAEQKEPESEPKADAIRGAAAIVRRISTVRRKTELEEAKEYQKQRWLESTEAPVEGEIYEWDGLHRRKTVLGLGQRRTTYQAVRINSASHPPLGQSRIPQSVPEEEESPKIEGESSIPTRSSSILSDLTRKVSYAIRTGWKPLQSHENGDSPVVTGEELGKDTSYVGARVVQSETTHIEEGHFAPGPLRSSTSVSKSLKHQFSFEYEQSEANAGLAPSIHKPTATEKIARHYASDEETRGLVHSMYSTEEEYARSRPGLSRNISSSSASSTGLRPENPFAESPVQAHERGFSNEVAHF